MSQVPSQDGTIPFTAPGTDKVCSTYYKVIGDRSSGAPPIVYLHGGPGGGHDYLVPFAQQIWTTYGIPGVLYDQLGCGSSTRLPERAGDGSFWTISLFIAELDNLLDHLCLRNGFHIFGQSWGGMLGADFATSRPPGLCRLVIASGLASHATMVQGTKLLRADLTSEQQATLNKAEESALKENFDEWDSLAAQEILALMASKHVCRAKTMPSELLPAFKNLSEDPTVYQAMYVEVVDFLWESYLLTLLGLESTGSLLQDR